MLPTKTTMSSREIADRTDKQHAHVMEAIRTMEPAWIKAGQSSFRLTYYTDLWNRQQPQYELSKVECLYVATKFNDEARARLILRWEELENEKQQIVPLHDDAIISQAFDIINKRNKILLEENEKLEDENKHQAQKIAQDAPKVLFADSVTASDNAILINELAKILKQNGIEIGQNRLFEWLRKHGYLCTKGDLYNQPTQYAMELGLFEVKRRTINPPDGPGFVTVTTKVTPKGQIYFVNKFLAAA